ncbi:MAG: hypothetical protein P8183_14395 [Anaerolineae bacterium]
MSMEPIGFKLLLSYEVNPESQQDYYQFIMGSYVPAVQAMGLQMSEAWHTAYGEAPNRLIGFVTDNEENIMSLLENETWRQLNEQLEKYVSEFSYKVIPYRGGFQI